MTFALSRLMSAGTASYGVFALAQPRHLGNVLTDERKKQRQYDALARTYGARDLALSCFGIFGRSSKTVTTAMLLRVAMDVADGLLLVRETEDEDARAKVLAVTMGWATLNTLALAADRRRLRR